MNHQFELPGVDVPWSIPPRFRPTLQNYLVLGDAGKISELCDIPLEIAQDACDLWFVGIYSFLSFFRDKSEQTQIIRANQEFEKLERKILDSLIWQKQKHD